MQIIIDVGKETVEGGKEARKVARLQRLDKLMQISTRKGALQITERTQNLSEKEKLSVDKVV